MKPVEAICADDRFYLNLSMLGKSSITSKQHIEELFSFHLDHGHLHFTGTQRRIHFEFANHPFHPLHISEQHVPVLPSLGRFQLRIHTNRLRIGTDGH
ncbi:hypothetical protein D1872_249210 [compost metagenome]